MDHVCRERVVTMNDCSKTDSPKGRLEVVCGSMFSGKTEELMRRLRRAEFAKQRVLTIKHHIDKRFKNAPTCIISHEGRERFAFVVADEVVEQFNSNEFMPFLSSAYAQGPLHPYVDNTSDDALGILSEEVRK